MVEDLTKKGKWKKGREADSAENDRVEEGAGWRLLRGPVDVPMMLMMLLLLLRLMMSMRTNLKWEQWWPCLVVREEEEVVRR